MEPGTKGKARAALAEEVMENPLRARLAAELKVRSMNPSELAEALGKPLPPIAYHCRVLEEADGQGLPGGM